jgi:probable phosphoglycerate mutase
VRLVLWRHGQTVWNAERRFQGQSDIPLDTTGEAQAERAARLLAALRPRLIVSSDLQRATMTAAPLARLTGLEITVDKDLRERFGGRWEGLTDAEIRAQYPAEHAAWSPPDGETSAVVAHRAKAAMRRIADGMAAGALAVVVSHGAAIRLGMSELLGLPQELSGILGPLANCSWSVIDRRRDRWRLLEHNAGTLPEPVLGDDR